MDEQKSSSCKVPQAIEYTENIGASEPTVVERIELDQLGPIIVNHVYFNS